MQRTGDDAIAAPWVSTPGYLSDRARAIHDSLHNLNLAIDRVRDAGRLDRNGGKYKAWKALLARWGKWYGETSAATWLWSGTDATLEQYEQSIRDWQAWFRMTFPESSRELAPAPRRIKSPASPAELPWWLWGVGAAAGTFILWRVTR